MNRQERRAAAQQNARQPRGAGGNVADLLAEGIRFHQRGQLAEAEARYRKLLALAPNNVDGIHLLGVIAHQQGRHQEAIDLIARAIVLNGKVAIFHQNIGAAYRSLGRLDEAVSHFEQATRLQPGLVDAYANLGSTLMAMGEPLRAFDAARTALGYREDANIKRLLVSALKVLRFTSNAGDIAELATRVLEESWERPYELSAASATLLKPDPVVSGPIGRSAKAWPARLSATELFVDAAGFAAVAGNRLLRCLLTATPIADVELERLLTNVRRQLLDAAVRDDDAVPDDGALAFYCALAQQCFVNEYVYPHSDDEIALARQLRESLSKALDTGAPVPALWSVAAAAYFPLYTLPSAERLLEKSWPAPLTALLTQQVLEPRQEAVYRESMPRLTGIENEVSLAVQQQYEENPYPRWVRLARDVIPESFDAFLHTKFPLTPFTELGKTTGVEILIAGCGTGQQPMEVRRQFLGAHVLAVDLSLASLSYASRKTRELGLDHIEYAQADILKLGSLGKTFDVIESVGVLHHLDDPMQGWRVLLSLLRPGGLMRLGFYSELARSSIVAARDFIAQRAYGRTAEDIRQCRQDLWELGPQGPISRIAEFADFYSTSSCRDLLFHVQEHRLTLPVIAGFLKAHNLAFVGFDTSPQVHEKYRARFPDDTARTNLDYWHTFETENPDTFAGMYQFWIQKP